MPKLRASLEPACSALRLAQETGQDYYVSPVDGRPADSGFDDDEAMSERASLSAERGMYLVVVLVISGGVLMLAGLAGLAFGGGERLALAGMYSMAVLYGFAALILVYLLVRNTIRRWMF